MSTSTGSLRNNRHATARRPRGDPQARTVTQDIQELGGLAKEMAQEKAAQLRASVAEYGEEGRERVQQVERSFAKYVAEQPLTSVLIAVGVGLLLGGFWMRR
jgi:ElaB/YqjD/DUF883 family membrane-anchored ribosome-binding protein